MIGRKNLLIALDFDDVLVDCNSIITSLAKERYGIEVPFDEITWNFNNVRNDDERAKIQSLFSDPEIIAQQKLRKGASAMVDALQARGHEVVIASAVYLELMTQRALQIRTLLPQIPKKNIILGGRKDLLNVDVLLDDRLENASIYGSVKYPVLFRRPWNMEASGKLAVKEYDEFLILVDTLCAANNNSFENTDKKIICLIGASGSGKTTITDAVVNSCSEFEKPKTMTTRKQRSYESNDAYTFIDSPLFNRFEKEGMFLETTTYAGCQYGLPRSAIDNIKKHAIMPIDIHGAIAVKRHYGNRAILVYIERNKDKLITEILGRTIPEAEKVNRLLSIDNEYANKVYCDVVLDNNGTIESAVNQIKKLV